MQNIGLKQFSALDVTKTIPVEELSAEQKIKFDLEMIPVTVNCEKHGKQVLNVIRMYANLARCPECEKESEKARVLEEQQERKERELKFMKNCNIEPEYYEASLENYETKSESQKKAFAAVKQLADSGSGKVILLGSNGVGKTHLGVAAIKSIGGGKIYSMYEITTMIRQSYSPRATETELEIVDRLARVPMLVIDELGRTKGSGSELNWLSYILDKRHTRKLPFMILSNTHLKRNCKCGGCENCFENYVGNDIISRLHQDTEIITMSGEDFRKR